MNHFVDEVLKKAIFAGFLGGIAGAIYYRREIKQGLALGAASVFGQIFKVANYIAADSLRLLSASIIIAALMIAWTFRYENIGKDMYLNRITGTVFYAYPD